ncbi:TcpE family conjugal transfer membrane protein [Thermoactinomyces sp. DSM 45892]|uniref:TcpE family conjugal transfer membrane protein n=1 Tax=Thermoactinomyces sp. DSM 45892 TaxID=1882753 RepID=UPI000898F071|nr:TcpE family conjugal transfer membrane protein [Thermoactinomyces sp. DSM 45892]SDY82935.1 TcpE family protein [Thermoactinomyces sp. DSM 45892]
MKEYVKSYSAAWDSSLRVYVNFWKLSFCLSLQEFIFTALFWVIMVGLDWIGLSFAPLVHYGLIPIGGAYLVSKIRPEGIPLHHWLWSTMVFLFSKKYVSGNFESVDLEKDKLQILRRRGE